MAYLLEESSKTQGFVANDVDAMSTDLKIGVRRSEAMLNRTVTDLISWLLPKKWDRATNNDE